LRYASLGIVGGTIGLVSTRRSVLRSLWLCAAVYLVLRVLLLSLVNLRYPVYLVDVLLTTTSLYAVGLRMQGRNPWVGMVVLLGRYSLVSYLFQIAFLQAWRFLRLGGITHTTLFAFFAASFATVGFVLWLDYLRGRSRQIDSAYRFVFG